MLSILSFYADKLFSLWGVVSDGRFSKQFIQQKSLDGCYLKILQPGFFLPEIMESIFLLKHRHFYIWYWGLLGVLGKAKKLSLRHHARNRIHTPINTRIHTNSPGPDHTTGAPVLVTVTWKTVPAAPGNCIWQWHPCQNVFSAASGFPCQLLLG